MKNFHYGRQSINQADIRAVVKVLQSDWITQGPLIDFFERRLANACGSKYAVAVSSGTAALHLACLASGLKKGDEAITSPISFLASANSIVYAGAKPVFADINPETINIDAEEINRKITRKTKVLLPVHFAGLPCDMASINRIAKKHKLIVIEDASHALGAKYKVKGQWLKVGCCKHSDMSTFSFHPVKSITTGEGGAITTNDRYFYEKLKMLRNHGMVKDKATIRKGHWMYEMRSLGFNYRITDIQCALGISQLKRLSQFISRRKQLARTYQKCFSHIEGISCTFEPSQFRSAYHLFAVKIDFSRFKTSRKQLMNRLTKCGISTQVHYIPIYTQPFYKKILKVKNAAKLYPNAQEYYSQALSLPLYSDLKVSDVKYVVKRLLQSLGC